MLSSIRVTVEATGVIATEILSYMGLRTFLGLKKQDAHLAPSPPIGGIRRPFWRSEYKRKFMRGDWNDRIKPLLDFGVDYSGKTILDAGCNLGIVGYEIAKFHPTFYHGIDNYRPALEVARAIFTGVSVEHRFDRLDMARTDLLARTLKPTYDIVLLLRVYQQVVSDHGDATARRMLAVLASRCSDSLIATCRADQGVAVVSVLDAAGFGVKAATPAGPSEKYSWYLFARE